MEASAEKKKELVLFEGSLKDYAEMLLKIISFLKGFFVLLQPQNSAKAMVNHYKSLIINRMSGGG